MTRWNDVTCPECNAKLNRKRDRAFISILVIVGVVILLFPIDLLKPYGAIGFILGAVIVAAVISVIDYKMVNLIESET